MVNHITTERREKYMGKCEKFANFINSKNIILTDREFLTYKKFLWKTDKIEQSKHIIEILLGYFICDYKSKTLVVCDHIMSKIFRYKTKNLLNHKTGIDSCLDVVSKHELLSNINMYHHKKWDRVVVFGTCEHIPPTEKCIFVTSAEKRCLAKSTLV